MYLLPVCLSTYIHLFRTSLKLYFPLLLLLLLLLIIIIIIIINLHTNVCNISFNILQEVPLQRVLGHLKFAWLCDVPHQCQLELAPSTREDKRLQITDGLMDENSLYYQTLANNTKAFQNILKLQCAAQTYISLIGRKCVCNAPERWLFCKGCSVNEDYSLPSLFIKPINIQNVWHMWRMLCFQWSASYCTNIKCCHHRFFHVFKTVHMSCQCNQCSS